MIEQFDGWVFDCDGKHSLACAASASCCAFLLPSCTSTACPPAGTIWKGNQLIPGAAEVLELLRSLGKTVLYVTNNSMKSRADYLKKFRQLGLQATEVSAAPPLPPAGAFGQG